MTPSPIFPTTGWEPRTPASQGIDPAGLTRALAALESGCGADGVAETVLIRSGYLVHQGPGSRVTHNVWSCTKSFASTALSLLIADGLCTLDSPAANFEPLLREKYSHVTLRHFVTMTSGFQAAGANRFGQDSLDWTDQPFVPAEPLFAPGTAYAYWDNAMNMFGRVLVQIARCDLKDLLQERITGPIGIGDWNWPYDFAVDSIPVRYASSALELNAHQLARFGWLFLNQGRWDGQQLVSPEWVAQATSVQVPTVLPVAPTDRAHIDGRGVYGLNWWLNGIKANGERAIPHAPAGTYYAVGLHNNRCIVIPEWNMVFVRMGRDEPESPDAYDRFFALLGEAI